MAKLTIADPKTPIKYSTIPQTSTLALPLSLATQKGAAITSIAKAVSAIQQDLHQIEDENQLNEVLPAIVTDIQAGILGTGDLTGTVFAGRTRIRGLTGTSKASAGNVVFKNTSITGTSLLTIPLTGAVSSIDPYVPDNGVLFKAGAYVNLTAADVTGITVYYDG